MEATVGLIDYGAGNLRSIANAFEHLGADVEMVRHPDDLEDVTHVVLPGVGAFAHCRQTFLASGLEPAVTQWARVEQRPTLGICVGMQLMTEGSEEFGATPGLGWFPGTVTALTATPPQNRVPHVGWSEVRFRQPIGDIATGTAMDFYFDHSFALQSTSEAVRLADCAHSAPFIAMLVDGNLVATQCHPEKSQRAGLRLLQAFLSLEG